MLYECTVCGYIYDESKEKVKWEELPDDWVCVICDSGKAYFERLEEEEETESAQEAERTDQEMTGEDLLDDTLTGSKEESLAYPGTFSRTNDSVETYMDIIHEMAVTGQPVIEPMRSRVKVPSWEEILIVGAQLDPFVLEEDAPVSTRTVIGSKARKPMVIEHPVFITHMSFGALSKN